MLRENDLHATPWIDKTMSVIRAHQLEACEKRLNELPDKGIFNCGDEQAAALWRLSYDGQEHPMLGRLWSMQELQSRVMMRAPAEVTLLSEAEEELVERMVGQNCFTPLNDWNELDAAEMLVRRLWCVIIRHEEHMALLLQPPLMMTAGMVLNSKEYDDLRDKLAAFSNRVYALLYLYGALPADEAVSGLNEIVHGTYADDEALVMRFLRTSYDYICDRSGRMTLIHPGLAHPETVRATHEAWKTQLSGEVLDAASGGLLPEEKPYFNRMLGTLRGAMRPEVGEEDAAQDLLILAKQNVSLAETEEVLSSMLMVQPTGLMKEALKALWLNTPRWNGAHTGVLQ